MSSEEPDLVREPLLGDAGVLPRRDDAASLPLLAPFSFSAAARAFGDEVLMIHSESSHFHSVVRWSCAFGSLLVGAGVSVDLGAGRWNEEGGETGERCTSDLCPLDRLQIG